VQWQRTLWPAVCRSRRTTQGDDGPWTPRHAPSWPVTGVRAAASVPSACGRSVLAPPVNPPCVTPSRMGCPTGAGPRRSPERSASSSAPPPLARVATTRGASGVHGWDVRRGRCSKTLAHHMGAITRCMCHDNLTRAAASRAHDMERTTRRRAAQPRTYPTPRAGSACGRRGDGP
jgi:hypothetical protein